MIKFLIMKPKAKLLILMIVLIGGMSSCKMLAKGAAKYWTKKQVKEFVANCEDKSKRLLGQEKAAKFCDCAVDKVAENYKNYDEMKKASIVEVLKIAKGCK